MKKWIIGLLAVIILAFVSVYIFIPRNIIVSKTVVINCTVNGAYRFLADETKWNKWWPSTELDKNANIFIYKEKKYRIEQRLYNSVQISIQDSVEKIGSKINIFSLPNGLIAVEWVCKIDSSSNPLKKIFSYRQGKIIQNDFTEILERLRLFLEKKENVYGFQIHQTSTKDTLLISTKSVFPTKPSITEIHNLIEVLKKYMTQEGAKQTGFPLLNITQSESGEFQTMVALPIDKTLKGNKEISPKRMIPGNFLLSEIKGGDASIENAFVEMNLYVGDYGKGIVALPFQVMVTDRYVETDTSKWITQIYFPIY
ncbi:MAG: hypothetical protein JST75_03585 [Bacteroidetes bacterium]|nr:hypothetical protein [Bacteroidota bacterium]